MAVCERQFDSHSQLHENMIKETQHREVHWKSGAKRITASAAELLSIGCSRAGQRRAVLHKMLREVGEDHDDNTSFPLKSHPLTHKIHTRASKLNCNVTLRPQRCHDTDQRVATASQAWPEARRLVGE